MVLDMKKVMDIIDMSMVVVIEDMVVLAALVDMVDMEDISISEVDISMVGEELM